MSLPLAYSRCNPGYGVNKTGKAILFGDSDFLKFIDNRQPEAISE